MKRKFGIRRRATASGIEAGRPRPQKLQLVIALADYGSAGSRFGAT